MVDLKCKCTNCVSNNNCNCLAKEITVSSESVCKSFKQKHLNNNTEYADEIFQPLVRQDVDIICHARCLFSNNGKCVANGITVDAERDSAICDTFLPE